MFKQDLHKKGLELIVGAVAACVVAVPGGLYAQSSPLTVQPSTGRVGINIGASSPAETLDVNGTVRATAFKGDGSQLTNLQVAPAHSVLDRVTANTTVTNKTAETALYSFSVPGGTLGTGNVLRLTVQITTLISG